jgi:hypothetical protein
VWLSIDPSSLRGEGKKTKFYLTCDSLCPLFASP